jgi:hypothetical protein
LLVDLFLASNSCKKNRFSQSVAEYERQHMWGSSHEIAHDERFNQMGLFFSSSSSSDEEEADLALHSLTSNADTFNTPRTTRYLEQINEELGGHDAELESSTAPSSSDSEHSRSLERAAPAYEQSADATAFVPMPNIVSAESTLTTVDQQLRDQKTKDPSESREEKFIRNLRRNGLDGFKISIVMNSKLTIEEILETPSEELEQALKELFNLTPLAARLLVRNLKDAAKEFENNSTLQ